MSDAKANEAQPAETPAETKAPSAGESTGTETQTPPSPPSGGGQFIWATGRRKTAIARVRIRPGSGKFLVNGREVDQFFTELRDQNAVRSPLAVTNMKGHWDIWANVSGGGFTGQAGAVALGLARALAEAVPETDSALRDAGLLTRDSRMSERKKPGQPGARKRFQFSKR